MWALHRLSHLLAPVFVIGFAELSFILTRITHHNTSTTPLPFLHFCPMPPKATTKTKKWGQADNKDLLADLINRQLIDITDTTYPNIEQVRQLHFRNCDKRNFCRIFCDHSSVGP